LTPAILTGHVINVLRALPDNSVQCVVTSPPYWGLRAYGTEPQVWGGSPDHRHEWVATFPRRVRDSDDTSGEIQRAHAGASYDAQGGQECACGAWRGELGLEPTPEGFVDHLASVFDEVRRVLRSDGTLWLNLGDTYATHPSGLTGEKRWKASTLANRDFTGHEQAGQMDKRAPGLKPKDLVGVPWRAAFELQRRGWWLRSDCVWAKPNPMPESVIDRPTRSHEYVFLLTKSGRYFYDADAVRTPYPPGTITRLSQATFDSQTGGPKDYGPGSNRSARRAIVNLKGRALAPQIGDDPSAFASGGANIKSVWRIPTQPYAEAHFATFPELVPDLCIRAGTSERGACSRCGAPYRREIHAEGGTIGSDWHPDKSLVKGRVQGIVAQGSHDGSYRRIDLGFRASCQCPGTLPVPCVVLDPFAGSGTVLAVARSLGRRSLGVELNPEYVSLARRRCSANVPDLARFEVAVA